MTTRAVTADDLVRLGEAAVELLGGVDAASPAPVVARAAHLASPPPPLLEDEAPAVAAAVEKRRREFGWGRALARELLETLGQPRRPIPRRADRSPAWPPGYWGSITHTDEVALVAVAGPGHPTFGIDLEGAEPLPTDFFPHVLRSEERSAIGEDPALAKVLFSAKEAFYKAQHVHTGTLLDFLDVEVLLNSASQTFHLEVHHPSKANLPAEPSGAWIHLGPFVLATARVG